MKKELDYFTIEGCYGGNQDWFTNLVMHMGGCAAATACDSCIYFGLQNEKMKPLYPFDIDNLTKEDYKAQARNMGIVWIPCSVGSSLAAVIMVRGRLWTIYSRCK